MLAQLVVAIQQKERWVVASDDIAKAFDNVLIDFTMEVHARHLRDTDILPLIDVVLRGGDPNHKVGIDQGSPYMPLALNVCLHEAFDNQAHRLGGKPDTSTPWMRYADNLALTLHDIEEGEQALQETRQLLQKVGFTLKGENHGHPDRSALGWNSRASWFPALRQGERDPFPTWCGGVEQAPDRSAQGP